MLFLVQKYYGQAPLSKSQLVSYNTGTNTKSGTWYPKLCIIKLPGPD